MPDEASRKAVALEYCRRMNAGDLDEVVALFAADARFEDPVGAPPMVGHAAIGKHLGAAIESEVRETPGEPVAALDGEHVLLPITLVMRGPGRPGRGWLRLRLIAQLRIGADGLITGMRVFCGRTDVEVVAGPDAPAATGPAGSVARAVNGVDKAPHTPRPRVG